MPMFRCIHDAVYSQSQFFGGTSDPNTYNNNIPPKPDSIVTLHRTLSKLPQPTLRGAKKKAADRQRLFQSRGDQTYFTRLTM